MGRLIDADVLKKDLTRFYDGEVVARKLIDEQPTVDAVEVVRCRDCKNSEHWYADRRRCFLWHENGVSVFDGGFCNYGERKDGDNG